jgi:hypothetical protein
MPRYYFCIFDDDVTLDEEGAEFADVHAAIAYAIKQARVLAAQTVLNGHLTLSDRIEITDQDHEVIETVLFGDGVEVRDT